MLEKRFIGFYLFAFILPLPLPLIYSAIFMGLLIINAILLSKRKNLKVSYWVILCGFFALIDLSRSILFDNSFLDGFATVKIVFLIIPILFLSIGDRLVNQKKNILRFFVFGTTIYVCYAICYLFYFYIKYSKWYSFSFMDHYVIYVLYNYLPGAFHHTYIGLYLIFAIVVLLNEMFNAKSRNRKVLLFGLTALLFFSQFYIGSKMTMLISFLVTGFFVVRIKMNRKKSTLILGGILLTTTFFFFLIKDWILLTIRNSIEYRLEYAREVILLIKNNFWFGIGLQNIKENFILINGELKPLIPHNLYLHDLLSNGLLGLGLLFFIFYFLFFEAKKNKNFLFFIFITTCLLLGFTEDFLYLQRGVFFFLFFATLFLTSKKKTTV